VSTKQQRADWIGKRLEELYPQVEVPLKHRDAYTLLVAVMLSAQCTNRRVNEVTPALLAKEDTPQKRVRLGQESIRNLIATCGLANTNPAHSLRTGALHRPRLRWNAVRNLQGESK